MTEVTRRAFLRSTGTAGASALGEGARWDESSLAGNALLKTPNIDRLGCEAAVLLAKQTADEECGAP